jgi:hypothetical protein
MMGRWLDALKAGAKISTEPRRGTDKTDKTHHAPVLSVLSVHAGGPREEFRGRNVAGTGGSVSFVSAQIGAQSKIAGAERDAKFCSVLPNGTDKTDKTHGVAPLAELFARVAMAGCPRTVSDERWLLFKADADRFLSTWGQQAARLGWTAADLFGLHPVAGLNRQDTTGLCWMLKSERVVALTSTEARLSGGLAHYRR